MSAIKYDLSFTKAKTDARKKRTKEILDLCKSACKNQGGMSEIGEGYVIVDTGKYTIKTK